MNKQTVTVKYIRSKVARINIELSVKDAIQLVSGHKNITNILIEDIGKALMFIEENSERQ